MDGTEGRPRAGSACLPQHGFVRVDTGRPRAGSACLPGTRGRTIPFLNPLRELISKKKRRFTEDDFDLDLAYVTPQLIAMGYPSTGVEAAYRNPLSEVLRLLEERHKGHYKIYNLCSEREYELGEYFPLVEWFPFKDHNPCPFCMLEQILHSIDKHLAEDPANVAAIHCKAGKGRTGLIACTYLLHSGECATVESAISMFAETRTKDGKGITIPSQIRYVHYYGESLRRKGVCVDLHTYQLLRVRLVTIPSPSRRHFNCEPFFKVKVWKHNGINRDTVTVYNYLDYTESPPRCYDQQDEFAELDCSRHDLRICGDVKLLFYHSLHGMHVRSHRKLCHLWFHTSFVNDNTLRFPKDAIDGACQDKRCNVFKEDFAIEVNLQRVFDARGATAPRKDIFDDSEEDDGEWEYDSELSLRGTPGRSPVYRKMLRQCRGFCCSDDHSSSNESDGAESMDSDGDSDKHSEDS